MKVQTLIDDGVYLRLCILAPSPEDQANHVAQYWLDLGNLRVVLRDTLQYNESLAAGLTLQRP